MSVLRICNFQISGPKSCKYATGPTCADPTPVGHVFIVTSESSRDKLMSSGQQTAVSGITMGLYLFRNVDHPGQTGQMVVSCRRHGPRRASRGEVSPGPAVRVVGSRRKAGGAWPSRQLVELARSRGCLAWRRMMS
jgi:hypothetical protein